MSKPNDDVTRSGSQFDVIDDPMDVELDYQVEEKPKRKRDKQKNEQRNTLIGIVTLVLIVFVLLAGIFFIQPPANPPDGYNYDVVIAIYAYAENLMTCLMPFTVAIAIGIFLGKLVGKLLVKMFL